MTLSFDLLTGNGTWHIVFLPHMNIIHEIGKEPQNGHGKRAGGRMDDMKPIYLQKLRYAKVIMNNVFKYTYRTSNKP